MIRNGGPQRDRQMALLHSHKGVGDQTFFFHYKFTFWRTEPQHWGMWKNTNPRTSYFDDIFCNARISSFFFRLRSGFRFQQLKFSGFRSQSTFWIGTIVQLFFQNCRFLDRVVSAVLLQYDQFHLESHYCYALNSCTTVVVQKSQTTTWDVYKPA